MHQKSSQAGASAETNFGPRKVMESLARQGVTGNPGRQRQIRRLLLSFSSFNHRVRSGIPPNINAGISNPSACPALNLTSAAMLLTTETALVTILAN